MEAAIREDAIIKFSAFGSFDRDIRVTGNTILFAGKSMDLLKVDGIIYGAEPIKFQMYTIGTRYIIRLRSDEQVFSIVLRSYLGIDNIMLVNVSPKLCMLFGIKPLRVYTTI